MIKLKNVIVLQIISFYLIFVLIFLPAKANGDDDNGEHDDDEGGVFGEDGSKELGYFAILLMIIGSGYILLKRTYVYSRRYLSKDEYPQLRNFIKETYSKLKSPFLNLHNVTMFLATLAAVIHGLVLGEAGEAIGISGWIAAIFMIVLSLSGAIIWLRFRPIWTYRTSRTHIRFIHQQWLFSGLMVLALIFHLFIED
jgi:hypothetical protein